MGTEVFVRCKDVDFGADVEIFLCGRWRSEGMPEGDLSVSSLKL